jgi:hypothetical protein
MGKHLLSLYELCMSLESIEERLVIERITRILVNIDENGLVSCGDSIVVRIIDDANFSGAAGSISDVQGP